MHPALQTAPPPRAELLRRLCVQLPSRSDTEAACAHLEREIAHLEAQSDAAEHQGGAGQRETGAGGGQPGTNKEDDQAGVKTRV